MLSLIDRRIPELTVESDDAQFGPAVGMAVHVTLRQVSMGGGGGSASVGGSEARVDWSIDAIGRTLHGLAGDVRTSAVDGTVDVTGVVGVVSVRLRPYVEGGIVSHRDRLLSRCAAAAGGGDRRPALAKSRRLSVGLRPESVTVTDSGIGVELRGGSAELPVRGDTC
ncbi:LmeA family phospholipid-binding protein [Nocardia sp. NPDC055002]